MANLSAPLHAAVFDALPYSMAVLDADGRIVNTNAEWRRFATANDAGEPNDFLGWSYLEVCGAARDEASAEIARALRALLSGERETLHVEYPCHSPDAYRWFLLHAVRVESGGEVFAAVSHLDITQRRLAELDAEIRAGSDELTGLLNRGSFRERLAHNLAQGKRTTVRRPIVVFFDLDGFKAINDRLGHPSGDRVLAVIGERLRKRFRGEDAAARFGGDEFTLMVEEQAGEQGLARVLERLHAAVSEPIQLSDGEQVAVAASAGVAHADEDGPDVDDLIARADAAMYRAKEQGGGCTIHARQPETEPV